MSSEVSTKSCGTCKTCQEEFSSPDPEKRDWLLIKHYQRTNHKHFRRWTTDQIKMS